MKHTSEQVTFVSDCHFGRFHQAYVTNASCRRHLSELSATAQHTGSLFDPFTSEEALRGVLFGLGINFRGWELRLPLDGANSSSHASSFSRVCGDGDLDVVIASVERTAVDENYFDEAGLTTPLLRAAVKGHLAVVLYQHELGGWQGGRVEEGRTPLH